MQNTGGQKKRRNTLISNLPWSRTRSTGVVLFLWALLSTLAPPHARAQLFTFQHYGQEDGLRNLDVFQMAQDRDGLLWVATENGLFRYDGASFRSFGAADGLDESMVLSLALDATGKIWAITTDHIYYFSGEKFVMVPDGPDAFRPGVGQRAAAIGPQGIVFLNQRSLMLVRQEVAHGAWKIVPYFSAQQIAAHPELAQLHSVLVDRGGALWLGCGQEVCRVQGGQVDIFGPSQGVPQEAALAIYQDGHGQLWTRGARHICVLGPGKRQFVNRDIRPLSLSRFIGVGLLGFAEDSEGNVLTETNKGLAQWDGSKWRTLDHTNGIDFDSVSTILTDRQGAIWIGTRGKGLYRWLGHGLVENWTTAQGLQSDLVWSIYRDRDQHVWVADQAQVSQLDGQSGRSSVRPAFRKVSFTQGDGITQTEDGDLWMVNLAGKVLRYNPATGRLRQLAGLPDTARLFQDSAHRIWFCTREGMYVAKHPDVDGKIEKISALLVSTDAFDDAAEGPDGDLWSVSDNHLYRLSGGQWTEISIDARATHGQIRTVAAAPDGTIWVGGGLPALLHLQIQGTSARILESFAPPVIASTDVQFARFDHRGWLWVGTDMGVNVFDGHLWRALSRQDGMVTNDCNEGAFFADSGGPIWVGVNGGAVHFLHPERSLQRGPLDVSITSAKLGADSVPLAGQGHSVFPWGIGPLDVHFTTRNYDREGTTVFRYRLVGLGNAWEQTTDRRLRYAAVPPGKYQFELQAVDTALQQASPVVSFTFQVRPPWWRTAPFYVFLVLLVMLAGMGLVRWKTSALLRKQQALQQLVAQRTQELEAEKAELLTAREALRLQASQDALTGTWNRSAVLEILQREMERAQRERTDLAVALADVDHFKHINDTYGHLAGDALLREVAQRMLGSVRSYDFVGRYGGEEFLLVLPGLSAHGPFHRLTQLQQGTSGRPFVYRNRSIHLTTSFGVAWMEQDGMTVEDMVRRADEALYRAKAAGRDRIVFYNAPAADGHP